MSDSIEKEIEDREMRLGKRINKKNQSEIKRKKLLEEIVKLKLQVKEVKDNLDKEIESQKDIKSLGEAKGLLLEMIKSLHCFYLLIAGEAHAP